MILTDSKIKGLKAQERDYYVWHDTESRSVGRVGIRVYPSGRKCFVFRYYENGKRKFSQLGDYPNVMLAEALRISKAYLDDLKTVVKDKASITQLFSDYIDDMKSSGKRSWKTTENRLKQVLDSQYIDENKAAKDISSTDIKLMLSEVIQRGAIAGSNKIRSNVHSAFNFGLRADNDPAKIKNSIIYGLTINPVTVVPKQQGVEKPGDRFLTWDELKELIVDCNKSDIDSVMHPFFKDLVLICIYSAGQRPWELVCNIVENIDFKNNTLTIPPELSKMKNYHVVPLSDNAISILKRRKIKTGYIFPAKTESGHLETSEFSKQIRKYCKYKGIESFTPRDIRRTFKTLAGEMGISQELRDRVQNHKKAGVSSKHYDRYDYLKEKREVISLWEEKLNLLLAD